MTIESAAVQNGGPAFGHAASNGHCCGMSLRDWFAGQALNGMLASDSSIDRTIVDKTVWAQVAYAFADAMLAAGLNLDQPPAIPPEGYEDQP